MSTTNTAVDLRAPLFAALDWYADLVANTREDHLTNQTPCTEFDVRALLDHVELVQHRLIGFATDHRDLYSDNQLPAQKQSGQKQSDVAPPADRAQHARSLAQQASTGWTEELLDTPIQLGWGPVLPGRIVAGIYLMEVLAHGWDLATTTDQPSEAPREIAEVGLAVTLQALPAEGRGVENGVPFGEVVPAAADAGPTEQLVNWTGRRSR